MDFTNIRSENNTLQENKNRSGLWIKGNNLPEIGEDTVREAIRRIKHPVFLVNLNGQIGTAQDGMISICDNIDQSSFINSHFSLREGYPLLAYAPPLLPEDFGDPLFRKKYNLKYAYIAGAMANGITSVKMVEAMGKGGMIGFFGAAGLPLNKVEDAIDKIQMLLPNHPFGFNLINSPNDPELESGIVNLYLKKGIKLVSASAYLDLTLPLIYFRVKGIHQDSSGNIICPNRIIAKVSRVEVARKFFSPPPEKLLAQLVEKKMITHEDAELAGNISVADDLTAEADSGGHTDNRPAISLLPTMIALRNEMAEKYKYKKIPCVGLGGGISTPESAAAAFAMGAAYVLTGSVNQSCAEAGTSETVRNMLAEAQQPDITMAPAADMFEMGVKVQVLKRGTMFPLRAAKLYDLYCKYNSIEDIPEKEKVILERDFFRRKIEEEWEHTRNFFELRDPRQIPRAEKDPKHKMALIFRSYLGQSSRWAVTGDPLRKIDYQIWCGPALGAFNEWVKGSFLEKPENRKVVTVAMNLLAGAAVVTRANWLRCQGIPLPHSAGYFSPLELSEIHKLLR